MVIRENLCKKITEAETQRMRNSQLLEGALLVQKQGGRRPIWLELSQQRGDKGWFEDVSSRLWSEILSKEWNFTQCNGNLLLMITSYLIAFPFRSP